MTEICIISTGAGLGDVDYIKPREAMPGIGSNMNILSRDITILECVAVECLLAGPNHCVFRAFGTYAVLFTVF